MHTFKEPHKPVSFRTKFDFIAWLQEEHISEMLASEATHSLPWYLGSCHNTAVLANEKQSPTASYHWESFSHLSLTGVMSHVTECFLTLSFSLLHRRKENISTHSINHWDGDISLSLSFLIPTLITSI